MEFIQEDIDVDNLKMWMERLMVKNSSRIAPYHITILATIPLELSLIIQSERPSIDYRITKVKVIYIKSPA